jgi:hypothetical protein
MGSIIRRPLQVPLTQEGTRRSSRKRGLYKRST